jgi:hypothetical protein
MTTSISKLSQVGALTNDTEGKINTNFTNLQATADGLAAGTKAFTGPVSAPGYTQPPVSLSGTTDAIPPHTSAFYMITTAGVDACTLAAPTAGTDDGKIIDIYSSTANAHTVTATGLFQDGSTTTDKATFAARAGCGISLMAFNGKWIVLTQSVGVTMS